jgi:hypothetical protein
MNFDIANSPDLTICLEAQNLAQAGYHATSKAVKTGGLRHGALVHHEIMY